MSDVQLDPVTWDLAITAGKLSLVQGPEARGQRLAVGFKHVRGEWFLDQNAGTDWFGKVLGKTSVLSQRAELRRRVLSVPGVRAVQAIALQLDPKTRALFGVVRLLDETGVEIDVPVEGVV